MAYNVNLVLTSPPTRDIRVRLFKIFHNSYLICLIVRSEGEGRIVGGIMIKKDNVTFLL